MKTWDDIYNFMLKNLKNGLKKRKIDLDFLCENSSIHKQNISSTLSGGRKGHGSMLVAIGKVGGVPAYEIAGQKAKKIKQKNKKS